MRIRNAVFIISAWTAIIALWIVASSFWRSGEVQKGQFILSAALLPIVIFGFLYTARQFRRSCRDPELDLCFDDDQESKERVVKIPDHNRRWGFRPRLLNTGEVVSVWYLVEINIPHILVETILPEGARRYQADEPHATGWAMERVRGSHLWVLKFRSKGKRAAYPGYEFDLPSILLDLDPRHKYEAAYPLHYRIFTEYGKCAEGYLTLLMNSEAKDKE